MKATGTLFTRTSHFSESGEGDKVTRYWDYGTVTPVIDLTSTRI